MVPVHGAHEGDHGQHSGHAQSGSDQDECKIRLLSQLRGMQIFNRPYIEKYCSESQNKATQPCNNSKDCIIHVPGGRGAAVQVEADPRHAHDHARRDVHLKIREDLSSKLLFVNV